MEKRNDIIIVFDFQRKSVGFMNVSTKHSVIISISIKLTENRSFEQVCYIYPRM